MPQCKSGKGRSGGETDHQRQAPRGSQAGNNPVSLMRSLSRDTLGKMDVAQGAPLLIVSCHLSHSPVSYYDERLSHARSLVGLRAVLFRLSIIGVRFLDHFDQDRSGRALSRGLEGFLRQ